MKMLNQTLATTTAVAALSLVTMTAVATPVQVHKTYPEVVVKESIVTQIVEYPEAKSAALLNPLNLTNVQKQKIQQINGRYPVRTDVLANDDKALLALQKERRQLVQNAQFDETRARNILSQENKILVRKQQQRGEIEMQRLRRDHAIYQELTPQQRVQWVKQHADRQVRW